MAAYPFWDRVKGLRAWSIVNCCLLAPTVVPLFALSQVSKAQRSLDEADFQRHRRNALIMNGICDGVIVAISIGRGLLVTAGVLPE
ncbi:MAG: hypothetical protein LBG11_03830 [Bifidobacteriaceae bacterium]|nr:hypothetical protein [Bifidobacteriaceae bacterium]